MTTEKSKENRYLEAYASFQSTNRLVGNSVEEQEDVLCNAQGGSQDTEPKSHGIILGMVSKRDKSKS